MLPASAEEAVERAVADAPSLIALHHDVLSAEAEVGTAESEFYPKLDVEDRAALRQDWIDRAATLGDIPEQAEE